MQASSSHNLTEMPTKGPERSTPTWGMRKPCAKDTKYATDR